ncbi:MAG: hypothetical protein ACE5FP_04315, partial [Gemmatimonadota bacterium]
MRKSPAVFSRAFPPDRLMRADPSTEPTVRYPPHGFAAHGFSAHGFAAHGFAAHGFAAHGFISPSSISAAHGFAHGFI